jgi:putative membrane protein
MTAPPSEYRLHPIALVLFLGGQLKEAVFFAAAILLGSGGDVFSSVIGGVITAAVFTAIVLVPAVVRLLTFRYRTDGNELVIRWGWLARKERHIPFARIQSLDARARLLHRLSGTVEVVVETGGGAEAEGRIAAIPAGDFEAMRARVLEGRRAPVGSGAELPAEEGSATLAHLGPRDLLLAGLVHNKGMLLVGALLALLYELGLGDRITTRIFGPEAGDDRIWQTILGLARGAVEITPRGALVVLGMVLLFLLAVRVLSMLLTIVRYHDHRLELVGTDLRVSCGLLTRSTSTTPIRRIQSVTVREGPFHRMLGRVTVHAATAGGVQFEASAPSRETLAPLLPAADLPRVLDVALDGLVVPPQPWGGPAAPSPRRQLIRSLLWWALPVAGAWLVGPPAGIAVTVLMLWTALAAQQRVRCFRWSAFDGGVVLRTGWLFRRTTIARHDRIQLAVIEESPFDRRHAMAEVTVDTAGASDSGLTFPWLTRGDAVRLARDVDAGIAATEFRL